MQDDESGVQKDNYHAKIYGVLSIMTVPILHFRHQLIRKVADLRIPLIDDNMSERDLRKAKNRQKMAGGFRKDSGHEMYCSILTIIETLKRRKMGLFENIKNYLWVHRLYFNRC